MNSYIFHFNLYDLAFLGAIFIGLTFASLLWFGKTVNRGANRFLALALVTMIVWMIRVLIIDIRVDTYLPMQFLLALGPLMYFYVLKITRPQYKFSRRDLFHFTPLLLEQVAWVLEIRESDATGTTTYATHVFRTLGPVMQVLIFISNITYLYLCDKHIQHFYRGLQPVLMDRPLIEFRWLRRLLAATAMLWLLWLVCAAVNYIGYRNQSGIQVYYLFYIFFVVMIIWTAAAAFLKPGAAVTAPTPTSARQPVPVELREKGILLKRAIEANLYYQDPELSLNLLAEKLNFHPHELSRVINTVFKKSFNDFINEYRLREMVSKMRNPAYDNITLLGIAYEVGFNSQSTYNRIFKQFTGKSAAEFKNSLKKEHSSYKMNGPAGRAAVISSHKTTPKWPDLKLNRHYMFRSYLKTAYRFLLKNKTFSFINIFGLALGTLCCLYILLYVQHQYSYDNHHTSGKNIYRVTTTTELTGDKHKLSTCSPPIAPAIKRDFPEVVQFARLYPSDLFGNNKNLVKYKDRIFNEKDLVYVDSTFFDVLSYHFVYGKNTRALLAEPNSIVLLKPVAEKLFGNDDPAGKIITIDNSYGKNDFKVAAVVDESLGNTHINANIFVTMRSGGFGQFLVNNSQWAGNNMMLSYIKLRPGADPVALEKKLPAFLDKYGGQNLQAFGMIKSLHLQAIHAVHTAPGFEFEIGNTISPTLLYILAGIAIMIQLIACINFMNLTTARASKRAKEVGVRKVVGARKGDLVQQFLGESLLLTLIGVLLALPLLFLLLPYLNSITQTSIQLSFLNHYSIWLTLAAIVIITGAAAGSYPAFYLSAFKAIKVIKGNYTSHASASGIRRSLVVFQFFLSIILITSIVIIYSQFNYIKNKDLGFDKSQKLIFNFYTEEARQKMAALSTGLQQLAEVKYVSLADNYLSRNAGSDFPVYLAGGNASTAVDAQNMASDEKFIKANGIKIIAGRDFDIKDSARTLINETLCKRLGLTTERAPGTKLYSKYFDGSIHSFEIVGVMKDFNYNSLHGEVGPYMIFHNGNPGNYFPFMTVSVNSTNYRSLLSKIETIWQKTLPGMPFEYTFLDQEVQKQYEAEISLSNIINAFTVIAIFISCLGLFGLAAFSAEQRSKEIGIRKVLGASVPGITTLLSKDFVKLVVIAFVIATPIAWWLMNKWLQGFVYKVQVSWWMFAIAGMLALVIAMATVSYQAIKAAVANPVKSLRTE